MLKAGENNTQLVVSNFIDCTALLAGIHMYPDINSKISTVSLDIIFTCIQIWYDMTAHTHNFFANLGHFQGIIICLYDNKRQ